MSIVVDEPRCRGCGAPVPPSASGRRLLAGASSSGVLVAWENLLHEKLNELKLSVDVEVFRSGFVCRKCFRSFQSFGDTKHKLLQSLGDAVKHMTTYPKESSPQDDSQAQAPESLLGKRQGQCRSEDEEQVTAAKRPRIQYNIPSTSTTSSSPNVQVRRWYSNIFINK